MTGAGATGPGITTESFCTSLRWRLFWMAASETDVTKKRSAAPVVIFDKNVAAPRAPKRVCELPAPNAAPMSAPFPACNRITITKKMQMIK